MNFVWDAENVNILSIYLTYLSTEFFTFFFQVLIMNHNPMRTLPPRAFHLAGLINVQKVYMRNCSLDDLDPTALAGLVILIELDLSENNIYELKDGTFLVSC